MTTALWVLAGAGVFAAVGTGLAFAVLAVLWAVNELVLWATGDREQR